MADFKVNDVIINIDKSTKLKILSKDTLKYRVKVLDHVHNDTIGQKLNISKNVVNTFYRTSLLNTLKNL